MTTLTGLRVAIFSTPQLSCKKPSHGCTSSGNAVQVSGCRLPSKSLQIGESRKFHGKLEQSLQRHRNSLALRAAASNSEVPQEVLEDAKFKLITKEDPHFGPPVMLLVGFSQEEVPQVAFMLQNMGGGFMQIVVCTDEMAKGTLSEAVHTQQPDPASITPGKGLPRVCFLSGLTGEEIMMAIDAYHKTDLKEAMFAAMVPNNADKPLPELIEEISGDHERLTGNGSGSASASAGEGESASASAGAGAGEGEVPMPVVNIDQHSDAQATVLELQFGDRLGALLDTMKALKDLGLNVVKGQVTTDAASGVGRNKFFITRADNGKKVEEPDMLEAIRLTVINNLLQYHPESSVKLAMGAVQQCVATATAEACFAPESANIKTSIKIESVDDGARSLLSVETADRAGLLVELVGVLRDLSIVVDSAEIDTEGFVAKDQFYVTYHGESLNKSMVEVVTNTLNYYLIRPDVDAEESY